MSHKQRYELIHYASNYFLPVNRTAFHYFCCRWPVTARSKGPLVSLKSRGMPRRRQDWTDPLPDAFWPELVRILAPGQSIVIMQSMLDHSGLSVFRHILNSDRERDVRLEYTLARKISLAEWAENWPDEPYPYHDLPDAGALSLIRTPVKDVQIVGAYTEGDDADEIESAA